MLHTASRFDAPAVSQILHGEPFEILDRAGDWAWGKTANDGYVGYTPIATLGSPPAASHRVTAREALIFICPDIKAPVVARWSLGALFSGEQRDGFLQVGQGFVNARQAARLGGTTDPIEVATRLIGAPYLWGGRGAGGIDCSGLVQLALSFAGIAAPRDSDQQRGLGNEISGGAPLQRGDLIFFPGHVGLMISAEKIIHATAHWMAVVIEPLGQVVARLAPMHDQPILARRRIAW